MKRSIPSREGFKNLNLDRGVRGTGSRARDNRCGLISMWFELSKCFIPDNVIVFNSACYVKSYSSHQTLVRFACEIEPWKSNNYCCYFYYYFLFSFVVLLSYMFISALRCHILWQANICSTRDAKRKHWSYCFCENLENWTMQNCVKYLV